MISFAVAAFFLAASLGYAGSAAGASPIPSTDIQHVHKDLQAKCDSCHVGNVKVAQLAKAAPTHCNQCHDQQQISAKIKNAALAEPVSSPSAKPAPADIGMRYPLYYDKTLRGDEPGEMVLIPSGAFIMGTNDRLSDEGPQHTVRLHAFHIDKYEVTNLQYKKFIDDTGRKSPKHFRNRTYPQGKIDHPVTFVTWYDAKEYCEWAGKRLPTDQEWEKAARGTDGRTYPWGNDFAIDRANTPQRWAQIKQDGDTTPVGAFEKGVSPYGIYDMSGNVWEWTSSWYEAYPGNKTTSENYGEHYKTLKGGSWFDCSFYKCGISAPVYNRSFFALKVNNDTFGFRCAKDAGKK